MMKTFSNTALVAVATLALAGCNCQQVTKKNYPTIEVRDAMGVELTSIDFGLVQVNVKAVQHVRVLNSGTGPLTISALTTAAPFGSDTTVPSTYAVGGEDDLLVTFTPTAADQRITGTLVIESDDPNRPSFTINLAGKGVTAVAQTTPNPVAFGDVYIKEMKTVRLTLTNAGGSELPVQGAQLTGSLTGVTADLAAFTTTLPANGGSASVDLVFAPNDPGAVSGALEINLDAMFGGKVTVPITGRGTSSDPRLCWQFDDSPMESCTSMTSTTLDVDFGGLCDNVLFGADAGGNACTLMNGVRTGHFYVRNDGTIPVKYTTRVLPQVPANLSCDGGAVSPSDFVFANAPDGGGQYTTPTVSVPNTEADPKPWESSPVTVTYRANSHCRAEASDQAQLFWTRQGEPITRTPSTIVMTLTGKSRLPAAKDSPLNLGTQAQPVNVPFATSVPFTGVINQGNAPLTVRQLRLYEEIFVQDVDGGNIDGGGPRGGFFQACNPASSTFLDSDCARFNWDPVAGNPAVLLPLVLDAGSPQAPASATIGKLFVGCYPDGGSCPTSQTKYRVYAVIDTSDPYAAQLIVPLEAWVRLPP